MLLLLGEIGLVLRLLGGDELGLGLLHERGDLGGKARGVGLVACHRGLEVVGVGLLVGEELLLLGALLLKCGFLALELRLEVLDRLDGLGVGVRDLAGVVQAAHEVVEARRVEQDAQEVGVAGAVACVHAVGEDVLGVGELLLLLGDGGLELLDLLVGRVEVRLALGELVFGLFELAAVALQRRHGGLVFRLGAREGGQRLLRGRGAQGDRVDAEHGEADEGQGRALEEQSAVEGSRGERAFSGGWEWRGKSGGCVWGVVALFRHVKIAFRSCVPRYCTNRGGNAKTVQEVGTKEGRA